MFSFIIPVYNSEKYLTECVESILRIHLNKEIILVDDGSTDSSGFLCRELDDKYSEVSYYSKKNGGAASARNTGIEKAKGELIVFVDSDDSLDTKWCQTISGIIEEKNDLFVYGMSFDYYKSNNLIKFLELSNIFSGVKKKKEIEDNFEEYFINNTLSSSCNKIFRKDIIDRYDIRFNERMNLYEDLDYVIRYLSHIDTICFIPYILYHYRHTDGNDNSYNRISNLYNVRKNIDILSESLNEFSKQESVHSVLSNLYMNIMMNNLMIKNYNKSELSELVEYYISNNNIVKEELSKGNRIIYQMAEGQQYSKLYSLIELKKVRSQIKSRIKKLIKNR